MGDKRIKGEIPGRKPGVNLGGRPKGSKNKVKKKGPAKKKG